MIDGDLRRLGALRGRGRQAADHPAGRGARGPGDVLLIGHHRSAEGDPVPAARPHRARRAPARAVRQPDHQHGRRRVPLPRAAVPHGSGGLLVDGPPRGRHRGGARAVGSDRVPRGHRALPRHHRPVRADDVRAAPQAAARGARALRRVVAAARQPRGGAVPGRGEAADHRVARPDRVGVLRRLRERRLHHGRPRRVARPPRHGRAAARCTTVHICDDDHHELPVGEVGNIWFDTPGAGFEYHGDPEKTKPRAGARRAGSTSATSATSTTTATSTSPIARASRSSAAA